MLDHVNPEHHLRSMIGYHCAYENSLVGMVMVQGKQREVVNVGLGIKQLAVEPRDATVAAYAESLSHKVRHLPHCFRRSLCHDSRSIIDEASAHTHSIVSLPTSFTAHSSRVNLHHRRRCRRCHPPPPLHFTCSKNGLHEGYRSTHGLRLVPTRIQYPRRNLHWRWSTLARLGIPPLQGPARRPAQGCYARGVLPMCHRTLQGNTRL